MDEKDREFVAALFGKLSGQIALLQQDLAQTRDELKGDIAQTNVELAQTRSDLIEQILQTRSDLVGQIDQTRSDLVGQIAQTRSDLVGQIVDSELRLTVLMESADQKVDLVIEGQQMLSERLDRVALELKEDIARVDQRETAIAADLSTHKADSKAHRPVYGVKEDGKNYGDEE